jgi:simple sugar transport system permease protein
MATLHEKPHTAAVAPGLPVDQLRAWIVKWGFIGVTVILFVYFFATEPTFGRGATLISILKYTSVTAIAGLGLTTSMAVGGLDLSIGGVAGMAVTVSAMTMVIYDQAGWVAVVIVLLAGALVGFVNGILIVKLRIPDLLATLSMMYTIQGLKLIFVQGQSVSSGMPLPNGTVASGRFTPDFLWIDNGNIGPLPTSVVIFVVLTFVAWFFLMRTRWGRVMYAIGANPEAARLSGANVSRYRIGAYVISGLFAAVAGLILASRIGQGDITAGDSLLLDSVAVGLLGMSVMGLNLPNAWGTALGAVMLGIVLTGSTIAGFPYYAQDTLEGVILIIALMFSYSLSRKKARYVSAVSAANG